MKKIFDFKNINKESLYIGDIYIIKNKKEKEIAKKDAILVKVTDEYYVDIDSIKDLVDCDYINFYIKNNIETNILLKEDLLNLYVGKLFITNIKSFVEFKKKEINIMELKLLQNKK